MSNIKYNRIHLYLRQTAHNKISPTRVPWFNYEKAFKNLLDTINPSLVSLTVCFDGTQSGYDSHFTKKYENFIPFRVKLIDTKSFVGKSYENDGSSKSYCLVTQIIKDDNLPEDSLVFIGENDYIYQNLDWAKIVLDLYNSQKDQNFYVSLYDHLDKYIFNQDQETIKQHNLESHWGMYKGLKSEILLSSYCHWRSVPSICSTWIFPIQLFYRDVTYHEIGTSDNTLCNEISNKYNTKFLSPIPSLNCHSETYFIAPYINWQEINNNTKLL